MIITDEFVEPTVPRGESSMPRARGLNKGGLKRRMESKPMHRFFRVLRLCSARASSKLPIDLHSIDDLAKRWLRRCVIYRRRDIARVYLVTSVQK